MIFLYKLHRMYSLFFDREIIKYVFNCQDVDNTIHKLIELL